jgi:hypothetical protein
LNVGFNRSALEEVKLEVVFEDEDWMSMTLRSTMKPESESEEASIIPNKPFVRFYFNLPNRRMENIKGHPKLQDLIQGYFKC